MPITINGTGPIDGITSLNTSVSSTELGFLDGVTSGIQTQINTAGGLVKITDSTFTGQSTVSVNNCFSATYQNYLILCSNVTNTATSSNGLLLRLRSSGTDATTNYSSSAVYFNATYFNDKPTGHFSIGVAGSGANHAVSFMISNPFAAEPTSITGTNGGDGADFRSSAFGGRHSASTSYDGFTIFPQSNVISGNLRVYGYRN